MAAQEGTLEGKVALISGSSLGLGAAIARELFNRGATVVINYPFASEKPNADKVLASLNATSRSLAVEADLSTKEGPKILADAAAKAFGKIDILVNCAGIARMFPLDDPDDDKVSAIFEGVINLNARGTFFLTRSVLPHLSRNNSRIINVGSCASRTRDPGSSIYSGSKSMVEAFTQCWAKELPRKYGCTVNGVAPGATGTETFLAAPQEVRDSLRPFIDTTPVAPRLGTPEEVAWVVAMLCEEKAGWLNGVYVPVSGGGSMF